MAHSILLYNTSSQESKLLTDIIEALRSEDYFTISLTRYKGVSANGRAWLPQSQWIALIALPVWWVLHAGNFFLRTIFSRSRTLICVQWPEKIILSPWARLLGWRVFWLETPDSVMSHNWLTAGLSRYIGRGSEIIAFSQIKSQKWHTSNHIHYLAPAPSPHMNSRQLDLFKVLADQPRRARFVIGAVVSNLEPKLIEPLLSALRQALTVCPTLELMIIGEGDGRKSLLWLIRRMGLGNHVWLAGESANLNRHFEYIDVYVVPQACPTLEEISLAIVVLAQGIPVIGQVGSGLEAIIVPSVGVLVEIGNTEALAAEFLRFEQLLELKDKVAKAAQEHARQFTFAKLVKDFKTVLD